MATASINRNDYRKILLNRGNKTTPDYTVVNNLVLSLNENTPNIGDSGLTGLIPISNGTVLDNGSTNLTGIGAGSNSTDNVVTFKQGAGETDVTAQNLIKGSSSVAAGWSGVIASPYGDDSKFSSAWLYIKDSTVLDKIVSIELKIGVDSSNYYSETYLNADLAILWNFLTKEDVLSSWTETGTVSGNIDYFEIEIITNNSSDVFIAGDIVYDLLRQWESSDTLKSLITGYPGINETKLQSDHSFLLTVNEANGFLIPRLAAQNTDVIPLVAFDSLSDGDSKSNTDQWRVSFKNIVR